jgi:hypothetical protein
MRWVLVLLACLLIGCAGTAPTIPLHVGNKVTFECTTGRYVGEYHGETEDTILLVSDSAEGTNRWDVPKREIVSMQRGTPESRRRKRMIAGGILAGVGAPLAAGGALAIATAQSGGYIDISDVQRVVGVLMVLGGSVMTITGIVLLANGD